LLFNNKNLNILLPNYLRILKHIVILYQRSEKYIYGIISRSLTDGIKRAIGNVITETNLKKLFITFCLVSSAGGLWSA